MVDANPNTSRSTNSQAPSGGLDGATQKLPAVEAATAAAQGAAGAGEGGSQAKGAGPGPAKAVAKGAGGSKAAGGATSAATGRMSKAAGPGPVSKPAAGSASGSVSSVAFGSASRPATSSASGSVSGKLSSDSASLSQDAVASRRLAHGLSPETTSKAEAAELRRKEKEASAEERKRKFQKQQRAKVVRRSIIAVLLVLLVGILLAFWLLRWGMHDDAASIQGQWRVQGTDTIIDINDEEIVLTDEVAYDYVLDPDSKTLAFTFGGLTGSGRYRFSLDHSMLSIDDGDFDWGATLAADVPWILDAVAQELMGNPTKSPSLGEGDMVLERVS